MDNDLDRVSVEINQRVKLAMAERHLDYAAAMRWLMLDDRSLWRRYRDASNRCLSTPSVRRIDEGVAKRDSEISQLVHDLVQLKIAASEGRINYCAALKAVFNENPVLAERHKAAMG